MDHVSYTELRQNLKKHLDKVCDDRAPLVVTRRNGDAVVVLSLAEYEASRGDVASAKRSSECGASAEIDGASANAGELCRIRPDRMNVLFTRAAGVDYLGGKMATKKWSDRINRLISEIQRAPFSGIGKPEPLRGDLTGWWSRRITGEHRFVYRIVGSASETQRLEIMSVSVPLLRAGTEQSASTTPRCGRGDRQSRGGRCRRALRAHRRCRRRFRRR